MTIAATFSTGHTDTYKGTRAVRAAWAVIRRSDGEILMSGHSLDRAKAAKTAAGNLRYLGSNVGVDLPLFDVPRRLWAGADYSYLFKTAAKYGYEGRAHLSTYKRWAAAKNAERRAAIEAATHIEIIDI